MTSRISNIYSSQSHHNPYTSPSASYSSYYMTKPAPSSLPRSPSQERFRATFTKQMPSNINQSMPVSSPISNGVGDTFIRCSLRNRPLNSSLSHAGAITGNHQVAHHSTAAHNNNSNAFTYHNNNLFQNSSIPTQSSLIRRTTSASPSRHGAPSPTSSSSSSSAYNYPPSSSAAAAAAAAAGGGGGAGLRSPSSQHGVVRERERERERGRTPSPARSRFPLQSAATASNGVGTAFYSPQPTPPSLKASTPIRQLSSSSMSREQTHTQSSTSSLPVASRPHSTPDVASPTSPSSHSTTAASTAGPHSSHHVLNSHHEATRDKPNVTIPAGTNQHHTHSLSKVASLTTTHSNPRLQAISSHMQPLNTTSSTISSQSSLRSMTNSNSSLSPTHAHSNNHIHSNATPVKLSSAAATPVMLTPTKTSGFSSTPSAAPPSSTLTIPHRSAAANPVTPTRPLHHEVTRRLEALQVHTPTSPSPVPNSAMSPASRNSISSSFDLSPARHFDVSFVESDTETGGGTGAISEDEEEKERIIIARAVSRRNSFSESTNEEMKQQYRQAYADQASPSSRLHSLTPRSQSQIHLTHHSRTTTLSSPSPLPDAHSHGHNHARMMNHSSHISSNERIRGLVGLVNLGNTCFMNSCLQCLFSCAPLMRYFQQSFSDELNMKSRTKGALAKSFGALSRRMESLPDHSAERPTGIKQYIACIAPQFQGYGQHDSQEFLRCLLSGLHDDLNRITIMPKYEEIKDGENDSDTVKSNRWWSNYTARNSSIISDLFSGQLKSSVACTVCKHVSVCFDPFMDLSLPLPKSARAAASGGLFSHSHSHSHSHPSVPLSACFAEFLSEELLTDNEQVYCKNCKTHRDCRKVLQVWRYPPILVLHLKRFSYGIRTRSKLNTEVDIPLELDVSRMAPAPPAAQTPPVYDLFAVSNHSGGTGGGHYTATCQVSTNRHSPFYLFNDSSVYPAKSVKGPEAYVLFYKKRD